MVFFKKVAAKYHYLRWQQHYQIKKRLYAVARLFKDVDGFFLSKSSRRQDDLSLTYGEINLSSFLALLSLTHPKPEWIFYDLGCGLGKTVIAASLTYRFQKSIGIECLPALIKHVAENHHSTNTNFICGDIFTHSYHDADLIFVNIASFVPEIWDNLSQILQAYSDAKIITCAKPLNHSEVLHQTWVECSWGIIPAYIQKFSKKE